MSYTQNPNQHPYPPQGAPQGYPQQPYPGQQGYGGPPQGHYNAPPPPQGAYPPAPSAHGYPQGPGYHPQQPHHGGPPQSQYPPPHGGPGYHPPAGGYQHPGPYGAPAPGQFQAPPSPPSIGYVDGQIAPGDFRREADLLRKAMKGFGTDENALIEVLSKLDPLQMAAVRQTYTNHLHRDLYNDVKSETSNYFEMGLLAVIDGPLLHDVTSVREAIDGIGTKEWLLNDVLLGRSNADLKAIKNKYHQKYSRSLEKDVLGDLSSKTGTLFANVLRAERHEESYPVDPHTIEAEVRALHSATSGRMSKDIAEFGGIFARSSNDELRSINAAYKSRYNVSLEDAIKKEFSGDVEAALLYILLTAVDPAKRDAELFHECMKGAGTKDQRLVRRVVRVHWNKDHLDQVKRAYKHWYKQDLLQRVREETRGDYEKLMLALLH